jgi:hypothetical protein
LSSILKALQRLQGGRGSAGSPAPKPALQGQLARDLTAPPLIPPGNAPAETALRPSRRRLALFAVPIAAALLAVALVGWWLAVRGEDAAVPVAGEPQAPPAVAAAPAPRTRETAAPRPSPSPERARRTPAIAPLATAPAPAPPARAAAMAAPPAERTDPAPERDRVRAVRPARRPARTESEAPRFEVVAEATTQPAPIPAEPENPDVRPGAVPPDPAPPRASAPARPAEKPAAPPAKKREAKPAPAASGDEADVSVLRTVWHPKAGRRVARLRLAGAESAIEVHEGDAVGGFVVKTIEPSGVLLLQNGRELRRTVGNHGAADD